MAHKQWITSKPSSEHRISYQYRNPVHSVLIIYKRGVRAVSDAVKTMIPKLYNSGFSILLESNDPLVSEFAYTTRMQSTHEIDLCICVGGDGTLLHLNSLFQTSGVPVIAAFAMGTLSFLTNLNIDEFDQIIASLLNAHIEPVPLTLRMRLWCDIPATFNYQVLNELVVYRGTGSHLLNTEIYVDNDYVTSVRSDGLIVSSPTGSTAYSMSAGGSMVSPLVPAILITPICPHSLSFRPLILPDSSRITLKIISDQACISLDGQHKHQLVRNSSISITMSTFPCPMLTHHTGNDWFRQLRDKLGWSRL
jgi:NAD+ kinase